MTFGEMKSLTLNLVAEANYDRFAETFVETTINLGCVDFLDKTEVIDTHWTRVTAADQMWYKVPTGTYEITRVEWQDATDDEWHLLQRKTMEEMDEEYPLDSRAEENKSWQQITGSPVVWIPREHDVIGIYPACDVTGDTLKIYGREKHHKAGAETELVADSDESEIPTVYQVVPCIYAARMLLRSDNDEKAASFERWYKEEVMLAKKQIKERKKKMPSRWRMYTY